MPRVSMSSLTNPRRGRRGKGPAEAGAGGPSTVPPDGADVPVRVIPAGLTGADLPRVDLNALRVGSLWLRGCQRVRIRALPPGCVVFTELTHGGNLRHVPRATFLRTARPLGRADA